MGTGTGGARREWPAWVLAGLALLAVMLAVAPWGNYPVNDDWQYALRRVTTRGRTSSAIDTAIAPSLVGQLVMAWPFMKVFGFSHRLLRLLTLAMASFVLWVCDALLTEWEVPRRVRLRVLLVLVLNPLFVNLAHQLHDRVLRLRAGAGGRADLAARPAPRAGRRSVAGHPLGRCGVGGGAGRRDLLDAAVLHRGLPRAGRRHRGASWRWRATGVVWRFRGWPMLAGTVAFAATIGGYVVWAKHYGWLKPAFLGPLEHVLDVRRGRA